VTTGIVKALKFSFLLVSDEYFHGEQHDLLLPKNQASSMITGIHIFLRLPRYWFTTNRRNLISEIAL
ncbi:hypothetical protein, partial [Salmonella enterica]|uniref:hypothetical protein n=1 Tax=Salmonella enterica TaxID=28901 RepID=UPI001E29C2D2